MTLMSILLFMLLQIITYQSDIKRIAFGSCNQLFETHSFEILKTIQKQKPSNMIFLGDFTYLDKMVSPMKWQPERNVSQIQRKIRRITQSPQYKLFDKNHIQVNVVWDDHDYNQNDGGIHNPVKDTMLKIFLEEFNIKQALPPSLHQLIQIDSKIKVILLDVRSFKTKESIVHADTWIWLDSIFQKAKPGQFFIIGSGIQIIHDNKRIMERWDPKSRQKLFKLLLKHKIHAVLISGDVHYGEIGKRGIYEITSSGLSFSVSHHILFAQDMLKTIIPNQYSQSEDRYVDINFGIIQVQYNEEKEISKIYLKIKDENGQTQISKQIDYEDACLNILDLQEIGIDHQHYFWQHLIKKARQQPIKMLKLVLTFSIPWILILLTVIELFNFKIA